MQKKMINLVEFLTKRITELKLKINCTTRSKETLDLQKLIDLNLRLLNNLKR